MDEPRDPIEALWPPELEAALRLAARAHHHHFRKRTGGSRECAGTGEPLPEDCIPYLTHLAGTALILARLGAGTELIAAALLHDYLEDVAGEEGPAAIRAAAGEEVLRLVMAVTEDKHRERSAAETWEERKHHQLELLERAPEEVVLLKGADTLHNVLTLLEDLRATDDPATVWDRFNAPPHLQRWYLASVAAAVRRRLGAHPLAAALEAAVASLGRPEGP